MEDGNIQRRSITLPEPTSNRGSYSEPGYYIVDQAGSPMSERYDSPSLAFANLRGGAGVQYLDQPEGGHLNQPWPPELHTVVGHNQGEPMPQYSEADLLRAMASTNDLDEQRYLMGALEEVRRETRQVMAGAEQVDFAGPHHVGEERPYYPYHSGSFGSSSATDWLAEMASSNDGMAEHMLTMGSRFFIGCHPEVKADPVEYMTQALGVARVAAGQYEDVEGAVNIFMDHVANLARVDLSKIAQEGLLPWEAPPEQLPPVSTDEYSGPYSADQNTDKNTEPPGDNPPGLDNGESARAIMGGLSVLSSHPHISEFLFDPPTPEELAAASGPGNLNQNPNISGNQDQTPEPNDDGALSGSMEGTGPMVASRHQAASKSFGGDTHWQLVNALTQHDMKQQNKPHYNMYALPQYLHAAGEISKKIDGGMSPEEAIDAHLSGRLNDVARKAVGVPRSASVHQAADDDGDGGYKYIHHRPGHKDSEGKDAPWVVTQKGTGDVISSHASEEMAKDSFKAMMRSKHGGSLQTGSRAQAPQQMTYEEYLARLSPGGYPVAREFFSGAMAAHAPSENDPTVPGWGKRQGPKASVTERPAPFRGVTTRISAQVPRKPSPREYVPAGGMDEGQMRQHLQDHHGIGVVSDWENYGEGVSDPHGEHELDHRESGEIIHHYHPDISRSGRKIVAEFDTGHIQRFVDWAQSQGHDPDELGTLKKYEKEPGIGRATANGIADQYHMEDPDWRQKDRWNHIAANEDMLNPQAFERAVEDDAPALRPQPSGTYDPETAHEQSGEAAHDITGLIPQGDLAEPWSTISDFPNTGDAAVPSTRAQNQAALHQAIKWSPASGMAGRGSERERDPNGNLTGRIVPVGGDPYADFNPTHTYNPIGWDVFDARPHPGSNPITAGSPVQMHGKMDPSGHLVHVRDEDGNHQTIDKRSLGTLRREAAKPKEYEESPGFETGGTGEDTPGAYEPDRSSYSESPQGTADDTEGYEQAYSSGRQIDWSGTGEDVLGTVPVQGYVQDADHPNAEMWPFEQQPIGSPPQGAAAVADVPTAGMVSAEQTGSSYPQPNVTKNSRLDAWKANIVARTRS